jgi:cell division protease FtsH
MLQALKSFLPESHRDFMNSETPKPPPNPRDPEGPQRMPTRNFATILAILLLTFVLMHLAMGNRTQPETIAFIPDFQRMVEEGQVTQVTVVRNGMGGHHLLVQSRLADPLGNPREYKVEWLLTDSNMDWIQENVPKVTVTQANTMMRDVLWSIGPFMIVMILVYFIFIRQMRAAGKGAMSFGKSRAKMLTRDKNKITFKNVAGVEEAKEEVEEIIEFLRDPKRFQKLGGRIPKGVLLCGPPGTGKTLLAKAIAGEADVPFFSISGSDFVEMFVGVGASRVRDMFEQGKRHAPCIIFIDEIDAVGRSRFSGFGGGHDEREQTLNALLVEMDGFDTQEGVIIIAATNRPDVLDNALLRPGRFDRQITVDLPTLEGRVEIMRIHTKNIRVSADVDLNVVARGTPGFSGADLANLTNEAALQAARRNAEAVELEDFEEARDKVRFGRERRGKMMDDSEKLATAYHEAGHAIVLHLLEHTEPVHKVTIIPRGSSLGSTMQLPERDQYHTGKKKLEAMLVGFMGGRAAEEIAMDDICTGAVSDIERSTQIARAMVCRFGMNDELGPQAFGSNEEHLWMGREVSRSQHFSEETARKIDDQVTQILKFSHDEAVRILKENREALDVMAKLLVERETIDGRDVDDIVKYHRIRTPEERGDPPKSTPSPQDLVPLEERADDLVGAPDAEASASGEASEKDSGAEPSPNPA